MNSWMLKYSKLFISGSYMGNCLLCSALPGILIQSKHRFNTTFECISSLLFFTCFVLDSLPVKTHNPVVTFEKTAGRFCFLKPSRNNVNLIPLLKPQFWRFLSLQWIPMLLSLMFYFQLLSFSLFIFAASFNSRTPAACSSISNL